MNTKICGNCHAEISTSEFTKDNSQQDGLHRCCKPCKRALDKFRYQKNKNTKIDGDLEKEYYSTRKRRSHQEFISLLKISKGCSACGENVHPGVLDFHHIGSDKDLNISTLVGRNLPKLINEIQKCVVLCASCHRKHHHGVLNNNIAMIPIKFEEIIEISKNTDLYDLIVSVCNSGPFTKKKKIQPIDNHIDTSASTIRCWIFNTTLRQTIQVPVDELDNHLANGWAKGRIVKWDGSGKFALCKTCGKEFTKINDGKRYCSDECKEANIKSNNILKGREKEFIELVINDGLNVNQALKKCGYHYGNLGNYHKAAKRILDNKEHFLQQKC